MPTTARTLVNRTRRFVGDWPDHDALTASTSSTATTISVADGTLYPRNYLLEIDFEAMWIAATGVGTSVTVRRGAKGTTPATHASGDAIRLQPAFLNLEILDAINAGIQAAYPLIYKPVIDETLTVTAETYEYTVPSTVRHVSHLALKHTGQNNYSPIRSWTVNRGATPKLKFRQQQEPGATIRVVGYGPFTELAIADSLDTLWPTFAEDLLVEFAAARLTASGEARRVRVDTGPVDARENATRVGASMSASNALLQRFRLRLAEAALPPLPPHVVSVF